MNIIERHSVYGAPHQSPSMIVIHAMGEYIMSDDLETFNHAPDFLDQIHLSAHALVAPDGTVYRLRNDNEGAYHARGFNTNSLGMEILVQGQHNYATFIDTIKSPYLTTEQYQSALKQCREWVRLYGITNIVRHSDLSPGRKVDPGVGFPWRQFLQDLEISA